MNTTAKKKIIVVEDDHACETLLRRVIQSIDPGALIDWVESAEQATAAIEREHSTGKDYDLIIADIFLSGKTTGLDLWQAYRDRFPQTPILIVSSLPVNRFFDTIGHNTIAPTFLPKPFYVGECRQIIEALLTYH